MINEIQLIVCDECNTVSFGELVKCAQCEKMMKPAKFIRETIVAKDEPLTLTDLPRPWSEDSMKKCACSEPQISKLVIPGFCLVCKLPRR